jgi:hypothetical protein
VIALTHDLLRCERFEHLGDLAEALKVRLIQLRQPYTGDLVWNAIAHVQAVRKGRVTVPREAATRMKESPFKDLTAKEARRIWRDLLRRYTAARPIQLPQRNSMAAPEFFPRLVRVP